MKKLVFYVLCAAVVCALCSCSENAPENVTETTIPELTVMTKPVVVETVTELTEKIEETAANTEISETETEISSEITENIYKSYRPETQEYMEKLDKLEKFNEFLPLAAEGMVCDLNSDGIPEVIIEIAAMKSASAVFSVDSDGAFMAEPKGGTAFTDSDTAASYDGKLPKGYVFMEQEQFFAESHEGGSVAGQGGVIQIKLNGREITSEMVSEWSYGAKSYVYRGFENEEQYNAYLEDYFGSREPLNKPAPTAEWRVLSRYIAPYDIAELLDSYFES